MAKSKLKLDHALKQLQHTDLEDVEAAADFLKANRRPPVQLASWSKKMQELHGHDPKPMSISIVEQRILASGRVKQWYGEKLGYKSHPSSKARRRSGEKSRTFGFYNIVKGRTVPRRPEVRKKLSAMLGGVPSDFWRISDNGYLVARMVDELDERNRPVTKRLPDIPIEEM